MDLGLESCTDKLFILNILVNKMLEKAVPDTQWLLFVISVQISSLGANEYEISKNKATFVMSILEVDTTIVPVFFLLFYSLVPQTEVCLKYFGTKIPQNSHCG
jgi:hypothetical protein